MSATELVLKLVRLLCTTKNTVVFDARSMRFGTESSLRSFRPLHSSFVLEVHCLFVLSTSFFCWWNLFWDHARAPATYLFREPRQESTLCLVHSAVKQIHFCVYVCHCVANPGVGLCLVPDVDDIF